MGSFALEQRHVLVEENCRTRTNQAIETVHDLFYQELIVYIESYFDAKKKVMVRYVSISDVDDD